jgi:hypothetical protein
MANYAVLALERLNSKGVLKVIFIHGPNEVRKIISGLQDLPSCYLYPEGLVHLMLARE